MSEKHFNDTLSYCSPAHGGWGIIRPCALIPGSYLLFVCPAACFRHGSLGAIQHGFKNQISFLYIDKADIVNGYDQVILDGIEELLEKVRTEIRVLFVYVSCLDDFIGTDVEKVLSKAGEKHPDILFRAGHMNPIASSTKLPPLVTTLHAMTSVLPAWKDSEQDDGVSFFGNFVEIPAESDVVSVLEGSGHPVRQLITSSSFEAYLEMSRSRTTLLTKPASAYAVENLRKRTDITRFDMFVSYDTEIITEQYIKLGELLGEDLLSPALPWKTEAETAIAEALKAVKKQGAICAEKTEIKENAETAETAEIAEKAGNSGDAEEMLPVYISDSAVVFPFQLALALIRYGFNVRRVYAQQVAGPDKPYYVRLAAEHPEVEIIQSDHPLMHIRRTERENAISIGEEAAYLTQSLHMVNLSEDEGMLGFYGVKRLMNMISESVGETADIRKMIEEYGGIV